MQGTAAAKVFNRQRTVTPWPDIAHVVQGTPSPRRVGRRTWVIFPRYNRPLVAARLYVILHHRGPAWQPGVPYLEQPALEGHIGFMRDLTSRGLMVLGGPYQDDADANDIVGMAIIRADSLDAAEAIAGQDPSIATGLIVPRVRPWTAAMGDALAADG